MSSPAPSNDTAQQRRECLLLAQAERQRARELEVARQEAEFAAEMARLEEEAAKEEEERRLAEERRIEEEKRVKEEKRVAEEKRAAEERRIAEEKLAEERRIAEAMRLEDERIAELKKFEEELLIEEKRAAEKKRKELEKVAELKRREDKRAADAAEDAEEEREQNAAYVKLVEENRKEREKAAKELKKRQRHAPAAKTRAVDVVIPPLPSGSRSKVFKSKSVISDDSDVMDVDKEQVETPRGVKRKRPIKMIAKVSNRQVFGILFSTVSFWKGNVPAPISDFDAEEENREEAEEEREVPSPSQRRPACTRCVLLGKPAFCRPQSTTRRTQACELCHVQRQRCSWIEDHASRRSRGKRAKVEDEIYQGPAARVGERKFEGSGIAEQLATLAKHNEELVNIARRSLVLQQRMLHLMVRRERREEETENSEDEDEDGEGEDDEEAKEEDEEKRRKAIREGKRRAE
ncbi:hypothetical protein DFJ43DRAFT_1036964 [Lentinula guzmanii]|uniref:Uncharacterized protein n=1 Tax=Lentinula guzmanii TaxID=2804957 RepID=A0AA38JSW7_9AGAR|nr:hypothetical protein DFJ43DRAFT_1036964 [Lentinula guzmanii]